MDPTIVSVYEELSKSELIEAFYLLRSAAATDISIFMTILFAYVTAAVFIARRLSKFQLIGITFLYSGFGLLAVTGVYNQSRIGAHINFVLYGEFHRVYYAGLAASFSLVAAWIVSLAFMVHSRNRTGPPIES